MKAIILAAGKGTRLNKYTEHSPKGMLELFGKPILQYQIELLRKNNITDISIVKGYQPEKITFPGVKYYINDLFYKTNMVESLFCAKEELNDDMLIIYGDILFDDSVLLKIFCDHRDITVVVDMDWKNYWKARYNKVDFDIESLIIDKNDTIIELGYENPDLSLIDARYVGMIKLTKNGTIIFKSEYEKNHTIFHGKIWKNQRNFENAFMTDFLQHIIDQNYPVGAIKINNGWLEFDTNEDYENVLEWAKNGVLRNFINLEPYQ